MDMTTLDVQHVQELQRTLRNGRSIKELIAKLNRASLAGIMEYGCLRWVHPDDYLPLPQPVLDSSLGRALSEVRSELGLRTVGPQKSPPRDTNPRYAEFYVLEKDIADDEYFGEYLVRFEFSAKQIGIPRKTAVALQAALEEMAANVSNHAHALVPGLIGYEVRGSVAQFCVVDTGRGILESLRDNPAYAHLTVHSEAIKTSLRNGVSRISGDVRRGNGFNAVFKALAEQWGRLRFRSGEGLVTMHGMGLHADQGEERDLPYLKGFQVAVSCQTRPPE
jgi:hypothetical protein